MATISTKLARKRVSVCEYPDGRLEIRHGEHSLPYRVFDKMRQVNQAIIVDSKHLDAALEMARRLEAMLPERRRNITSQAASLSRAICLWRRRRTLKRHRG